MGYLNSITAVPDPGRGEISVYFEPDHTIILLQGDIDLAVSDDLEHAGRDAIDAGLAIVADARRVDMIDSVGVSFLIRVAASARAAGNPLTVHGPCPHVEELLTVAGAHSLFSWVDVTDGSS